MIVKVSRLREFLCKEIHDRDPGATLHQGYCPLLGAIIGTIMPCFQRMLVICPDRGVPFQPSFPIGSPEDFLKVLFTRLKGVVMQYCVNYFRLLDQTVSESSRESGNIFMPGDDAIALLPVKRNLG